MPENNGTQTIKEDSTMVKTVEVKQKAAKSKTEKPNAKTVAKKPVPRAKKAKPSFEVTGIDKDGMLAILAEFSKPRKSRKPAEWRFYVNGCGVQCNVLDNRKRSVIAGDGPVLYKKSYIRALSTKATFA